MSDGREESDSVVHPNSCAVSSDSAAVPKKKTARRLVDCRDHLHLYLCIVGVGKPLAIFDHDPEMSQMNQIHQYSTRAAWEKPMFPAPSTKHSRNVARVRTRCESGAATVADEDASDGMERVILSCQIFASCNRY
ncbi:hypothetical protein COCC4DRAFT_32757 [Bipolaris maydis ATCC 48331]|uniref:Uncharacterized protein n=2 Tax=Cochliobolus heterostrophus TaxID=5016 RepID=M2UG85_COCH5|nr:uncharacterized protein COCC4DRAFT_32757 [Bipolaris maydis ATCC 48331]EMD86983.1 hypothetical protein COCHEDRAFT_1023743 [Bipolaris maydis C5]ENI04022.1 hypothetical protein COCC4DRAFT_32757 [Bipolaris maydis ATCC 48331]